MMRGGSGGFFMMSSSSEEERDDIARHHESSESVPYHTPFKSQMNQLKRSLSTPLTVTQLTPSPMRTPSDTEASVSLSTMGPSSSSSTASLQRLEKSFLDDEVSTALFQDPTPARSQRKQNASLRRSRLSESLLLIDYERTSSSVGVERRRSSASHRKTGFFGINASPRSSSPDLSSLDTTPDSSPDRNSGFYVRTSSMGQQEVIISSYIPKTRGKSYLYLWGFLALCLSSCLGMIFLTQTALNLDPWHDVTRPEAPLSAAGLRGQMTSGHWAARMMRHHSTSKHADAHDENVSSLNEKNSRPKAKTGGTHDKRTTGHQPHHHTRGKDHQKESRPKLNGISFTMNLPHSPTFSVEKTFEAQDMNMYAHHASNRRRVVELDRSNTSIPPPRSIKLYPADFTDNTQLYSILDSSDERLKQMERREPHIQGECVPMQDWQTTFHPSCNGMHEIAINSMGEDNGEEVNLFGTKGFWRNAWRLDVPNLNQQDTIVLKTLKFQHNFEDAHFEHDRVDAVAMERLTSSPHVINVFGFCGHSVLTEYADGSSVGSLADKSKKTPLARLRIARDIAHGLADVHGIDGDGNATFVHLDINPANVVSIGGTLKLNDFNIGIIRRWNTTSNKPCGFPAQYPNPQWRSPEEAREEQNLTEKVDVFSMGHIFFRLICGHEPWNKLEPGGRPSKEEVSFKVQRGELPFIPDDVRNTDDPEVIAIRDAMLSCYTFDPLQRPSARDISNLLDKALESLSSNQ